jgi:transposase-like protein
VKKARRFSVDFKQEAVRRMAEATTVVGLAEELGIRRKLLYQWRDQLQAEGGGVAGATQGAGRQGANHKRFLRRLPGPQTCGLLNWNDCSLVSRRWIFKTSLRANPK